MADDELEQVGSPPGRPSRVCVKILPRYALHDLHSSSSKGVEVVKEGRATMRNKEGLLRNSFMCQLLHRLLTHWRYRKQESEARASILSQILEPQAADRLGRIRMVKESRATGVENRLIMMARSGQLRQKVTEEQLKELLASLAEHERETGSGVDKMKVIRRGGWDDDDLDDLLEGT